VRRTLVQLGQLVWILAGIVLPVLMLLALVVSGWATGPRPVDADELGLASAQVAPVEGGRAPVR
jgi:hypothetical protein